RGNVDRCVVVVLSDHRLGGCRRRLGGLKAGGKKEQRKDDRGLHFLVPFSVMCTWPLRVRMLVARSAWNSSARSLPSGPCPVTGSCPWIMFCFRFADALLECSS